MMTTMDGKNDNSKDGDHTSAEEVEQREERGKSQDEEGDDVDNDEISAVMTMLSEPIKCLPYWKYQGTAPNQKPMFDPLAPPEIESIDLGDYVRRDVTNLQPSGMSRDYFDVGLRLMLSYQVRRYQCTGCVSLPPLRLFIASWFDLFV